MGYTKSKTTVERDKISGEHQAVDITQGRHSVSELKNRLAARDAALKSAIAADSGENGKTTPESQHPSLGDAMSRLPKPDGGGRFGVSGSPEPKEIEQKDRAKRKLS